MNNYPFLGVFRARCQNVVDGDTADLLVDLGFHSFRVERLRLLNIDAPEMRKESYEQGVVAKAVLKSILMAEGEWPLKIVTKKDPDNFGRWLAEIFIVPTDGVEKSVCTMMVELGHAVWYQK